MAELQQFVDGAQVAPEVFALRPDYGVLLLAIDQVRTGPSDAASEALLRQAEAEAAARLSGAKPEELPHIAAWREAYRAFGAKPQRTRNSVEALLRRVPELPRINRLTDVYNAISVRYELPLGGEDLERYDGPPRLVRAAGDEPFDTAAEGETVIEHPEPGEVIWADASGVTCRRWNWRQCRRTGLREDTTQVIFIMDALDPLTDEQLNAAADELIEHLAGPESAVARRIVRAAG